MSLMAALRCFNAVVGSKTPRISSASLCLSTTTTATPSSYIIPPIPISATFLRPPKPLHLVRLAVCPKAIASSQQRQFSSSGSIPRPLDASKLLIVKKVGCVTPLPTENVQFGQFFSDHMLEVDWDLENGWDVPRIKPFQNLSLHPGSSGLHYGLQVFEGLKCFRDTNDRLRLFRIQDNLSRLQRSAARMSLPSFDEGELLKCIKELIKLDAHMVPAKEGFSLYVRPLIFSTQPTLGVSFPTRAKLCVITGPCGPYFGSGFASIKLAADPTFIRAFPGGPGDCKVGGNYGPTISPTTSWMDKGFAQMLWLFPTADDYEVTEVGAANFFLLWINEAGEKELVTASLGRNLLLPGIIRDTVLSLAKSTGEYKVTERDSLLMRRDIVKAFEEGRVLEAFACGTGAVICPINGISFEGVEYKIPADPSAPEMDIGPVAKKLLTSIWDIQYGRVQHPWSTLL